MQSKTKQLQYFDCHVGSTLNPNGSLYTETIKGVKPNNNEGILETSENKRKEGTQLGVKK